MAILRQNEEEFLETEARDYFQSNSVRTGRTINYPGIKANPWIYYPLSINFQLWLAVPISGHALPHKIVVKSLLDFVDKYLETKEAREFIAALQGKQSNILVKAKSNIREENQVSKKTFNKFINEMNETVQPSPVYNVNQNTKSETDWGDLHQIENPEVFDRLNTFVNSIARTTYTSLITVFNILEKKLYVGGYVVEGGFPQHKDITGDKGKFEGKLLAWGGVFDALTGTTSDGITHRLDGYGVDIVVNWSKTDLGEYSVTAELKKVKRPVKTTK